MRPTRSATLLASSICRCTRGMNGRYQERGRNALSGNVRDEKCHAASRQRQDVVVVAPHLAGREIRGGELHAGDCRQRARKDLALDRRRELQLALDALLLDRLAVEACRLDRGGRLVGEKRKQTRVRGREVENSPVARLLVADGRHSNAAARHRDGNDQALLARGQPQAGRRYSRRRVVDDGLALRQRPLPCALCGNEVSSPRLRSRRTRPSSWNTTSVPLPASVNEIERNRTSSASDERSSCPDRDSPRS